MLFYFISYTWAKLRERDKSGNYFFTPVSLLTLFSFPYKGF